VDPLAVDLLNKMLSPAPKRITIEAILAHPWLSGSPLWDSLKLEKQEKVSFSTPSPSLGHIVAPTPSTEVLSSTNSDTPKKSNGITEIREDQNNSPRNAQKTKLTKKKTIQKIFQNWSTKQSLSNTTNGGMSQSSSTPPSKKLSQISNFFHFPGIGMI